MPVTLIKADWDGGELVWYDKATGTEILRIKDGSDGVVVTGNMSVTGTLTSGATATSGTFPVGSRFTVVSDAIANATFPVPFFVAPAACKLISCYETHKTKSTTGQTAQLEYLASGTAPGSGTGMLSASIALDITNDTPQTVAAGSVSTLVAGDRIGLVTSASGATYAGGQFVATLQWT